MYDRGNMSPRQKEPLTYEHALLGFLYHEPLHAYALHRAVNASPIGRVWHVKQSALYAMTMRLEEESYVVMSGEATSPRGKKLLHITTRGITAFDTWCLDPVAHPRDIRMEFLAKLYCVQTFHPEHRGQLFVRQIAECDRWLMQQSQHTATPDHFLRAVEQFRVGQIHAIVEWLRACECQFAQ
jgi:DNA-binding PadR family transcriptional regulator